MTSDRQPASIRALRRHCGHSHQRETPDHPGQMLCDQCWGNLELCEQRHWNPEAADTFVECARELFPGSSELDEFAWARAGHAKASAGRRTA